MQKYQEEYAPTQTIHIQGEANVCDDINGDMHLLRLIKDWGYDSMLPQNR